MPGKVADQWCRYVGEQAGSALVVDFGWINASRTCGVGAIDQVLTE